MRILIPQLAWHYDHESTTSIDFHPYRNLLAVSATDSTGQNTYLRIWEIVLDKLRNVDSFESKLNEQESAAREKKPPQEMEDLFQRIFSVYCEISTGHMKTINCVRFSPNGLHMATCADDAKVIIWVEKWKPKAFGSKEYVSSWAEMKILTGHGNEVYDLKWFSDGSHIATSSLDFSVIIWNFEKGEMVQKLTGHTNYVKGVAVDPCGGRHVLSLSTDRSVRIYKVPKVGSSYSCKSHLKKVDFDLHPDAMQEEGVSQSFRLLMDETLIETLFRRPDWSPDGSFFLVPGAQYLKTRGTPGIPCVACFTRGRMSTPSLFMPVDKKPAILVRFCPMLFKSSEGDFNLFDLPYHMVWAVATIDKIHIFSTKSPRPLFMASNMHFSTLTDMTWFRSHLLAISSMDGYISFAVFEDGELGEPLPNELYPEFMQENLSLYRRQIAEFEQSRTTKREVVAQNEQQTVIRNGKKMIIPRKLIQKN